MSTASGQPRQRSFRGCLTCRRRRRKCDEERPTCRMCRENERQCEGYQLNLTWDVGIASRGRFQGASEPRKELAKSVAQGRIRDKRKQAASPNPVPQAADTSAQPQTIGPANALSYDSVNANDDDLRSAVRRSCTGGPVATQPNSATSHLSPDQQRLYDEFLESSHLMLYSADVHKSPVRRSVLHHVNESRALSLICAAVQAHLSAIPESDILRYYNKALVQFLEELGADELHIRAGTMTAGVLFCTFGIIREVAWTMHLNGLSTLIDYHWRSQAPAAIDPLVIHITEVMCIMDLPTFVVGRRTSYLHLWKRYRLQRSPDEPRMFDDGDVEATSGVPRSLLDLISCLDEPDIQARLWAWRGHIGEIEQCHLWEAYRFAALLNAAKFHPPTENRTHQNQDDVLIILRLMTALDAVFGGSDWPKADYLLTVNALLYPLFWAGVATAQSVRFARNYLQVKLWLKSLSTKQQPRSNARIVSSLLDDYERVVAADESYTLDPHRVAFEQKREIALL